MCACVCVCVCVHIRINVSGIIIFVAYSVEMSRASERASEEGGEGRGGKEGKGGRER